MKKTISIFLITCLLTVSLFSCQKSVDGVSTDTERVDGGTTALGTPVEGAPLEQEAGAVDTSQIEFKGKDEFKDYKDGVAITLSDSASSEGPNYTLGGGKLKITGEGTFVLSGKLSDGQIIVDAPKDVDVRLVLCGVEIYCSKSAPIFVNSADKVVVSLPEGYENKLSDKNESTTSDGVEITAALFSRENLTINGTGMLAVTGAKDGITSKDTLKITGGNITVDAKDDGIVGKDRVLIRDGNITVKSVGDGIKSTNDTDPDSGYIYIEGGKFDITSDGDGIDAQTSILITGGDLNIKTGGGSANVTSSGQMQGGGFFGRYPQGGSQSAVKNSVSTKALKAGNYLDISGGTFNIDSADDALHSKDIMRINKGKFNISTGDDGVHANTKLEISGGEIVISKSYEGVEAQDISISGGYIDITSSDDGINAAGGSDGNTDGDRMWQDRFNTSQNVKLEISGGEVYVNAKGDGVDSNGNLTISGGAVFVSGPTNSGNGYIDIGDGGYSFKMDGGIYLGVGTSGMLVTPSTESKQNSITASVSGAAGSTIAVKDAEGKELANFKAAKQFSMITISHPEIEIGDKVTVFVDGSESAVLECTSVSTGGGNSGFGGPGGMGGQGGMPSQGGRPNSKPM